MISFGPVPSRRLGKSLGINNIPSRKVCSYSCIYCQVGLTKKYCIARETFYEPRVVFSEVENHLGKLDENSKPDYLTFVANGEPTLDLNLGESIQKLKAFDIPIAVITNASLLKNQQVRDVLCLADWVSVKVDANNQTIWKAINKPLVNLSFEEHLEGIRCFSSQYKGLLVTETMLVQGVNDSVEQLTQTADFIAQINPSVAYISIPTRPPALSSVNPPDELVVNQAFQIFTDRGLMVELLLGFEGTNMGHTGNAIEDIINICTVHPIREDSIMELLEKNNADINTLNLLVQNKYVEKVKYKSDTFYIRKFHV